MADNRKTMAWCVFYPDSVNSNYLDILKSMHVPFAISPLHDHDLTASGEPKEPHYHLIIDYSETKTKKSRDQFTDIMQQIGTVRISPIDYEFFCVNRRLCYRYLCHLDDANKTQYDPNDVVFYGFSDSYNDVIYSERDLKTSVIPNMIFFIVQNHVTLYCDFALYCSQEEPEWNEALFRHTRYITEFIKSYAFYCKNHGVEEEYLCLEKGLQEYRTLPERK